MTGQLRGAMMALLTEEELAALVSRLEQQELDCQTGSGTVSQVTSRVTCSAANPVLWLGSVLVRLGRLTDLFSI